MANFESVVPLWSYDIAALVVFFALYRLFRDRPERSKRSLLWALCAINLVAYLINDYYFLKRGDNILTMLPLQLCNMAVFLVPLALGFRKRILNDFVFYVCALGAIAALIVPSSDYIGQTYSLMTASFFVFHFIIVLVPFLLAAWGLYRPNPTPRSVAMLSLAVFASAAVLHVFNIALNRFLGIEADYFFTVIRFSAPRNPAFALFASIVPYDLFYLLPALPILWVYMFLISLPWNWRAWFLRGRPATAGSKGNK
jgi:uncharacterized membrane protein YwaF